MYCFFPQLLSIFVGRLAPEKHLLFTVDAFAQVAQQLPEAHLAIVGPDAGSEQAVRQRVAMFDLTNRVHFLGLLSKDQLFKAYVDADLLVLLSRHENFGLAAVEAMAAGLPVLVSKEVGLAEDIKQAKTGFVVEPQVDQTISAWKKLLFDASLRKSMGERGRTLVYERYSIETIASQVLEVLQSVVQ